MSRKFILKYIPEFLQYLGALGLCTYGLYLLYFNSPSHTGADSVTPADGYLLHPTNDVRTKSLHDLDWNSVIDEQGIRYGDAIFTGPDSTVEMKVHPLELKISENTLIYLKKFDEQMTPFLHINEGAIQLHLAAGQKEIELVIGQEKFKITNKKHEDSLFSLSKGNPKSAENSVGLSVLEGNISLQTSAGEILEAPSGKSIQFESNHGKIKQIKNYQFQILKPRPDNLFLENDPFPITWTWTKGDNKDVRFLLKTSTDPKMRSPDIQQIPIDYNNSTLQTNKLGIPIPGNYFIQMTALTPEGLEINTLVVPIHIVQFRSPLIYDHSLKYLDPVRWTAMFQFERIKFLEHFEVEIARDRQFTDILLKNRVAQFSPSFILDQPGQSYLRTRYKLKNIENLSPWSETIAIDIPSPIPTPVLTLEKADRAEKKAKLSWDSDPQASFYELTWLGNETNFISSKLTLTDSNTFISLQVGKPQIVTVTAHADKVRRSLPSKPLVIPGLIPEPTWISLERSIPPLARVQSHPTSQILLKWSLFNSNHNSILELSKDSLFKEKTSHVVKGTEFETQVTPEETLYARVKEQVVPTEYFTDFSGVAVVSPKSLDQLPPPMPQLPKRNETLLIPKSYTPSVQLVWIPCPGAFGYDLELESTPTNQKSTLQKLTLKNAKKLITGPPPGKHRWRVRCHDRTRQSEWSPYWEFNISYGI